MPGDLVGGGYPLSYTFRKLIGLQSNAAQGNLTARSNVEWFGLGDLTDAAASLVTTDMTVVPVPVEVGDEISTVAVAVGNTAAGTPSHSWAAVYSGVLTTVAIQGAQSPDGSTAPIAAEAIFPFKLATAVIVTSTIAPYGYMYVGVGVTATTVPSLSGTNVAAHCQYARFADAPPFFAGTISASGATAPSTITLASVTPIATVPEVYVY